MIPAPRISATPASDTVGGSLPDELAEGHLGPDEHEQDGERGLEVVEALDEVGDEEEQRAQPEQGERVGRVDDERVGRDREDRGHRVDGEEHVDGAEGEQRRRAHRHAPRGQPPAEALDQGLLAAVLVAFLPQAPAGPDQERREREGDPAERMQRRRADEDEHAAQRERDQDPVGQQLRAALLGHAEGLEHDEEDEDVVERQRLLDEVARDEALGLALGAEEQQHAGEGQRERDPDDRPDRRVAHGHDAVAPAHDEQVDGQEDGEGGEQAAPSGDAGHAMRPPRVV